MSTIGTVTDATAVTQRHLVALTSRRAMICWLRVPVSGPLSA